MIYHESLFLDFFAPEIQIFLILIGWFQNAGFSFVDLNSFAPIFGALKKFGKFRRSECSARWEVTFINEIF